MKKYFKIMFTIVCALCVITPWRTPVMAQDTADFDSSKYAYHEISDINDLKYEDTMSEAEYIAYLEHIGKNVEVKKLKASAPMRASSYRYSNWAGKKCTYENGVYVAQAMFTVTLYYASSSSQPKIVGLSDGHVYTGGGISQCIFSGRINYHLSSGRSFYYTFYGDLYKTGTATWKAGAKVGIGGYAEAYTEVSWSNGHIRNISENETFYNSLFVE